MNPNMLSKIKEADADALRAGNITVGKDTFPVLVQTFTYNEFQEKIEAYKSAKDSENWEFLASLFFDPETRERIFTADDLKTLKAPTVAGLFKAFSDVNMGAVFASKK